MGFGFNNCIPGYQFDPMIWSVCSPNPFHTLNLMWNDSMMKLQCDSLMYQSPTISGAQGSFFPLFGGVNSSIPNMLAQQTFMQYQQQLNNWWSNPSIGGMNNSPFTNPASFWGNSPWGNNGTNSGSGAGDTVEGKELNRLNTLINELKKIEGFWTEDTKKAYNEAMKKSSTQDKVDALKELINGVDNKTVEKAVLATKKADLTKSGYNFEYLYGETEEDKSLKSNLESVHQELKEGKIDALCKQIADDGEKSDKILRNLSYWNSAYPNDKGILGMIADKIPNTTSERSNWVTAIHNITMQLVTKAAEYGDLDTKKTAIKEDLKKIDEAFKDGKDSLAIKSMINKMLPKYNELYCNIRVKEAQKINKEIREAYKLDVVSENIILDATKSDLESEGFSNIDIKAEKISKPRKSINHTSIKNQPADAQLSALKNGDLLEETDVEGIYTTKTDSSNADQKFYGVKDDKLVEYIGVKNAEEITEETQTKEIKDTKDIESYKDAVEKIDELIDEGKIKERKSVNGTRIYYAVDPTEKGWQYFTIRNNKLMEINIDKIIDADTVVMKNGSKKKFSALTDSDFKAFSSVHVKTEKSEEEKDEKDKTENKVTKTTEQRVKDKVKKDLDRSVETVGRRCADNLIGKTEDDEALYVENAISKLDKDNILLFLKGYSANSDGGNGFFEQIARENDKRWTNKKMVPLMRLVLDAIPEEYQSTNEYYEMDKICEKYEEIEEKNPNSQFVTSNLFGGGLGLGFWNETFALFGNSKLDDFDDYLSDLLEKMSISSTDKKEEKDKE